MGLGAFRSLMSGIWSNYSDWYSTEETEAIDLDSLMEWLDADEDKRARMEAEIGEDGKLRFIEAAKVRGFWKE